MRLGPNAQLPLVSALRRAEAIAYALGGFAVVGGALTLIGWAADLPRLTNWSNDGISMFPNTAVCIVASGIAIMLSAGTTSRARATLLLAAAVLAIGAATLFEHLTGVDLRIDTLLFDRPWGQAAAVAPMRMGPPASVSFLLIGTALLAASRGARGVSSGLGVVVAIIALLSLIGRAYGVEQMYTIPRLTGIAMQSASMILALGLGLIVNSPEREPMRTLLERSAAGMLARRALPTILALSLALGWGRLFIQHQGLVDTAFGTALRTLIEIVLVVGLLWAATAMIRAYEAALGESEGEVRRQAGQLGAFLDTAAICLHRVGHDGTILWANDAELKTFGYPREEYIGRPIADFHVDAEAIADMLARLRRGERLFEYPARMKCRDGSIKHVLIDSSVLWDEGRFVHTQCFTRDVTERERAEAEREESDRRKDEFIAILAHELRNPLAPVRSSARYLREKMPPDAGLQRSTEIIERQVGQMARLIEDLLDVSRMNLGTLALRRERVLWSEVLDMAVEASRDELNAKGHRLQTIVPESPIELDADRERMVQVLSNVLGNAARYTPAGGQITLSARLVGAGTLEISVKDNGIGIPAEKLTEIFDLFARVDRSLERQGGLGVGLTLVRQLVELHGGTVEARSAGLGSGSEILMRLPIVVPTTRPIPAVFQEPAQRAPLRILVADDNEDAAESLQLLLQLGGHDVRAVYDGEAALANVEEFLPQVAFVDIGMPKANGYEVARRLRQQAWGKQMFLVALTGWGNEADKRRAGEAGFDAHVVKPIPPEDLDRLLAGVVRTN